MLLLTFQSPQAGGHQLHQDNHLTTNGGSNELQQVGMADFSSHIHLSLEQLDVIRRDNLIVDAFSSNTYSSECSNLQSLQVPV